MKYIIEEDTNYSPIRWIIRRTTDGMIMDYTKRGREYAESLLKDYLGRCSKQDILSTEKLTEHQVSVIAGIDEEGKETFFHTSIYGSEVTPKTEGGYGGYAHVSAIRRLEKRGLITADHMWRGAICKLVLNREGDE